MGLLPEDFYAMTWKDYSRSAQGYWIRNGRSMEGIRRLCYYTVIMNADPKKAKSIKERKLFKVITDSTSTVEAPISKKRISVEEYEAIKKRYKI